MRAVLTYEGKVTATQGSKNVHEIRKQFHPQLKELWRIEDPLRIITERTEVLWDGKHIGCIYERPDGSWIAHPKNMHPVAPYRSKQEASIAVATNQITGPLCDPNNVTYAQINLSHVNGADYLADNCGVPPFRFLPMVTKELNLMCYLKIVMLRSDPPGALVKNGGDIDNQLKVIFDALRKPQNANEIGREKPDDGEDPFYCLLEDDKLISGFEVTTEQWLRPRETKAEDKEMRVTITAIVRPTRVNQENLAYLGGWL